MKTIQSPFKFLDPFTLADRDAFFGRDKEIEQLYDLVFKSPLLLIYGASGTGKTSLIQCGLASKFDGTDWLPLWIRRDVDINRAMDLSINHALPNPQNTEGGVTDKIQRLYQYYLRPVFLIFDQFEELFIFGTKPERDLFVENIKTILDNELPCNILIVIREEYLGQLYPFEKEIPELFDFRMRVEPMDSSHVKEVLDNSFSKFNISVELPKVDRFEQIIENVSRGKSGIELPYLQVYLDKLYKEDFERTYPNLSKTNDTEGWQKLTFTKKEIEDFGTIDNVLDKFLTEQQTEIQSLLSHKEPSLRLDTVRQLLDAFVSDEGTKRPIRYIRENDLIKLEAAEQNIFPKISAESLTFSLDALESSRLIRSDGKSMELAHDSLAALIDKRRTDEQRQRNDIKRQIRSMHQSFTRTNEYLTQKQITVFEDVLPDLNLEDELMQFFNNSQRFRAKESAEELELEKARRRRSNLIASLALIGFVIAIGVGIWAYQQRTDAILQRQKADLERDNAQKALEKYEIAQKAKEMTEFRITLQNVRGILKGGNCPPKDMQQKIKSVQEKYPSDTDLQSQITEILNQTNSNNCK
ncbi:MAG: ATP-binding protein [Saprospiraceae bacterium]|nr:ATP-binding protein [Saprospiraceae bacterium]